MDSGEITNLKSEEFEEFIAFDSKGRPMALHQSIAHPGIAPPNHGSMEGNEPVLPTQGRFFGGNLRFFADVNLLSRSIRKVSPST